MSPRLSSQFVGRNHKNVHWDSSALEQRKLIKLQISCNIMHTPRQVRKENQLLVSYCILILGRFSWATDKSWNCHFEQSQHRKTHLEQVFCWTYLSCPATGVGSRAHVDPMGSGGRTSPIKSLSCVDVKFCLWVTTCQTLNCSDTKKSPITYIIEARNADRSGTDPTKIGGKMTWKRI